VSPESEHAEPVERTGRRGRGGDVSQIIVISWRDIPAQVNAQRGREREQVILSAKFQRAIDRAKRKAKIYTAHEDIAQWKRVSRPCTDDLAAEAATEALKLETNYTKEHLGQLGFLGGWEPGNKPDDEVLDHSGEEDPEDDPEGAQDAQSSDWGTWSTKPETAVIELTSAVTDPQGTQP
jgi:hypothetical protein